MNMKELRAGSWGVFIFSSFYCKYRGRHFIEISETLITIGCREFTYKHWVKIMGLLRSRTADDPISYIKVKYETYAITRKGMMRATSRDASFLLMCNAEITTAEMTRIEKWADRVEKDRKKHRRKKK